LKQKLELVANGTSAGGMPKNLMKSNIKKMKVLDNELNTSEKEIYKKFKKKLKLKKKS